MYLNKHYHNPIHTFRKKSRLQAQSSVFLRDIEFLYAIDLKMTELTFTFDRGGVFFFYLIAIHKKYFLYSNSEPEGK